MDIKKFGSTVVFISLILIAASAYCYWSAFDMRFEIAHAIGDSITSFDNSIASKAYEKRNSLREKGFIFGVVGGIFLILGIGIKKSAKH